MPRDTVSIKAPLSKASLLGGELGKDSPLLLPGDAAPHQDLPGASQAPEQYRSYVPLSWALPCSAPAT